MIGIFHSADLDGHCSGAILKYRFPNIELIGMNYGDRFPFERIQANEEIYMVDFSLQPETEFFKLLNFTSNLVWIDHHIGAIREIERLGLEIKGIRYTEKAACELLWKYLYPEKEIPLPIKYLSLYDTWKFNGHSEEQDILAFQIRLRMMDINPINWKECQNFWENLFEIYDDSYDELFDEYIQEGNIILEYDKKQKEKYIKTYGFETVFGIDNKVYKCYAVNLEHTNSKIFDSIDSENYDLLITFIRRKDRLWNISFYSQKEEIDCSKIAKYFGGGGHKGASGCQVNSLPFKY